MTRTCTKCGIEKDEGDFYRDKKSKDGLQSWCKECSCAGSRARDATPEAKAAGKAYNKAWRQTPKGKASWRGYNLKANYPGFTQDHYDTLLAFQNGHCAICPATESGGHGHFHIDHDHSCCPGKKTCGKCIRGLLCHKCNIGMGHFNDDPALTQAATDYLTSGLRS